MEAGGGEVHRRGWMDARTATMMVAGHFGPISTAMQPPPRSLSRLSAASSRTQHNQSQNNQVVDIFKKEDALYARYALLRQLQGGYQSRAAICTAGHYGAAQV